MQYEVPKSWVNPYNRNDIGTSGWETEIDPAEEG